MRVASASDPDRCPRLTCLPHQRRQPLRRCHHPRNSRWLVSWRSPSAVATFSDGGFGDPGCFVVSGGGTDGECTNPGSGRRRPGRDPSRDVTRSATITGLQQLGHRAPCEGSARWLERAREELAAHPHHSPRTWPRRWSTTGAIGRNSCSVRTAVPGPRSATACKRYSRPRRVSSVGPRTARPDNRIAATAAFHRVQEGPDRSRHPAGRRPIVRTVGNSHRELAFRSTSCPAA